MTMMASGQRIGIAGAGLLGRLAAWTLSQQGHHVRVFDPAPGPQPAHDGHGAAGFTAAGMLSPLAERESADAELAARGWHSIARWEAITQALGTRRRAAPAFAREGSLMVAHGTDLGAAQRVLARLEAPGEPHAIPQEDSDEHAGGESAGIATQPRPRRLRAQELSVLEPSLHATAGVLHAWLLPGEAHIDTVGTLQALHDDAVDVQWHWARRVAQVAPGRVALDEGLGPSVGDFDWVLDLRGTGARHDCPVRGVRGEVVWLQAPGLGLRRPVRLLHPRHRVYIVPRADDVVLVGASEIESEDRSPVSLRSAVELMAAAHSVLPGLAEARIVRLDVNLRPALPDHRPVCQVEPGLIRINGLYRHGWLLAPSLLDEALQRAGLVKPGTSGVPA